jgi:DUF4097 and DUF4098 domain-containing protein YvlB
MNPLALTALLAFSLASPIAFARDDSGDDISKVNRSIRVETGQTAGDVSTVNGSIQIEDDARAQDVETVNGSVRIGRNAVVGVVDTVNGGITLEAGARAQSLETVNGGLKLEQGVQTTGSIQTVNGAVRLSADVEVGGGVENVNGSIELDHARVGGGLETTNGDITVGAGSHVRGGILVEKPSSNWLSRNKRLPKIVIGPNAVVEGALKFEHEVELYVSDTAKIGAVEGAKAISFSGERPKD